jgi:nitrogen fixation/metabolism regulation signal transduction histidine kinase
LLARAKHVASFLKEEVALNQQTLSFEDVETQLYRFANYFETDLALFSPTGELIYGTRPELFEAGLLAPLLNTQAKHALHEHGLTAFVQSEPLGQKTYEAAYIPVTYALGRPALVLQVPNYESSDQQRSELNGFLNNLLNIYVAALLGALLLSSLIARRLTSPLGALSKAIAQGNVNVAGMPSRNSQPDELNELLEQHQLALAKLQENAELLARMEKESAWRDMAKQVAHEIKNPLTPMLLSVQRLQRLQREQSPKLWEVFPKTAEILVEQIDSLRRIADEFSSFARMPEARRIPVDVVKIIGAQVSLYGENVAISLETDLMQAIILSDPDELARAIGNLLRNAIQATQDSQDNRGLFNQPRAPKITVSLTEEGSTYLVQVADNGSGIPEAIRPNIFTPNFTTKNSGMGLGLAMVRLTIEQAHGAIRFESEVGEGTTFFITLPAFNAGLNAF